MKIRMAIMPCPHDSSYYDSKRMNNQYYQVVYHVYFGNTLISKTVNRIMYSTFMASLFFQPMIFIF